jgi:hypothetical protein
MPEQYEKRRKAFEWLFQAQTANADGTETIKIHDQRSTLKCWGVFDGATVEVQILAEDAITWMPAFTFTKEGVQFGEIGSSEETFRASISGVGAGTSINVTMSY